jgi:hypothetical protein
MSFVNFMSNNRMIGQLREGRHSEENHPSMSTKGGSEYAVLAFVSESNRPPA